LIEDLSGREMVRKLRSRRSSVVEIDENSEKAFNSPSFYEKENNPAAVSSKPISGPKTDHIMISYNKESREVCLKVKSELEKDGHRIWIDVEDIHGSSLESMALAIERSKCVLICGFYFFNIFYTKKFLFLIKLK